jgi:uncharacterized protein (TIGR02231 family)
MRKLLLFAGLMLTVILLNAQGVSFPGTRGFIQEKSDTSRADATITNATVYFGYGAELTHESKVKVDASTKIIVIDRLSTNIDINSLQISCPEDVTLLSQRFNIFYPVQPVAVKSREVLRLEDSIALLQKDIQRIDNLILIEQETMTRTIALIEETIKTSGNKTITSDEVLKLLEYNNKKIETATTNIFNHGQSQKKLNELIAGIRVRILDLGNIVPVSMKPYGQVIMQVMCKKVDEVPVALSYYTRNAGWTPVYDIRVNSKTNKVKLVYKAALTQSSGIDWKKTKLTLSTGTPNFGVAAPVLTPWHLQQYVPGLYTDLQRRAAVANNQRNVIQSMSDDKVLGEMLAGKAAGVTVNRDAIDPSTLQQYTTLNEGQLNTNYEIDLPYDIESNGQLHSVTIKNQEVPCTLKSYAVPRLDKDAYLLAEVADWQNLDLLPGDANIIMDDTYTGKSVIDPNTTADTLNLSLGKDKRVNIKRSLVKEQSSIKTSGKESRQSFTYEITVKNNKLTDINLLLKDQHPLSTIKEVEVKLENNEEAVVNAETGVLTWKMQLKPGESKKVRYSYTVKYPKDMKIINLK